MTSTVEGRKQHARSSVRGEGSDGIFVASFRLSWGWLQKMHKWETC